VRGDLRSHRAGSEHGGFFDCDHSGVMILNECSFSKAEIQAKQGFYQQRQRRTEGGRRQRMASSFVGFLHFLLRVLNRERDKI
jgi:hypothetical protein